MVGIVSVNFPVKSTKSTAKLAIEWWISKYSGSIPGDELSKLIKKLTDSVESRLSSQEWFIIETTSVSLKGQLLGPVLVANLNILKFPKNIKMKIYKDRIEVCKGSFSEKWEIVYKK